MPWPYTRIVQIVEFAVHALSVGGEEIERSVQGYSSDLVKDLGEGGATDDGSVDHVYTTPSTLANAPSTALRLLHSLVEFAVCRLNVPRDHKVT